MMSKTRNPKLKYGKVINGKPCLIIGEKVVTIEEYLRREKENRNV